MGLGFPKGPRPMRRTGRTLWTIEYEPHRKDHDLPKPRVFTNNFIVAAWTEWWLGMRELIRFTRSPKTCIRRVQITKHREVTRHG